MPRCLMFVVCRESITNKDNGELSLIGIINGVGLLRGANEEISPDDSIPMKWDAVSLWLQLPEDEGKTFEQQVCFVQPTGRIIGGTAMSFSFKDRIIHIRLHGLVLPVGSPGENVFRLNLREVGGQHHSDWATVAEFPIEIASPQSECMPPGNSIQNILPTQVPAKPTV